jgi:hypothetical protein
MLPSDLWPGTTAPPRLQNNPSPDLQVPGRAREEYLDSHTAASPRCLNGNNQNISNTPGKAQQLDYRQLMNNHNTKEELQAMQKSFSTSASVLV